MSVIESAFVSLALFSLLAMIGFFFLIGGYGVLRVLRVPVSWVTWIIGTAIMAASIAFSLVVLIPNHFAAAHRLSSLLGGLSFLIAVYSASQWVIRRWYLHIKKHTSAFLVKGSRNVLLFLRKHHAFFGWVVILAAIGHTIYYLPVLLQVSLYAVITGFIALGILLLSVLLGVWIWLQVRVRKQRMPKTVRMLHSALAIAFFAILVGGHFGAWLLAKGTH